jgi:hypothetical protein
VPALLPNSKTILGRAFFSLFSLFSSPVVVVSVPVVFPVPEPALANNNNADVALSIARESEDKR